MSRRPEDRYITISSLPEVSRTALELAIIRHRAALESLTSSVCAFARGLRAQDMSRQDILVAAHEHIAELRASSAVDYEDDDNDRVLHAIIVPCLDESAA